MMNSIRSTIRSLTPPIIVAPARSLLRRWPELRFEGNFITWKDAQRQCEGYSTKEIVDKVSEATDFVIKNPNYIERDGVIIERGEPPFHLLWCLEKTASEFGELKVLDFGGALGSHYRSIRQYFPEGAKVTWSIIEQGSFVKLAPKYETRELKFFENVESLIQNQRTPNIIILSSVLQYIPNTLQVIERLSEIGAKYLFIDRTPMLQGKETAIVVQKIPASIYKATYAANLIGSETYRRTLHQKWKTVCSWQCPESLPWLNKKTILQVPFSGVLLEKNQ
jgi:putative methyltransferase (TIGR04325 family)